MLRVVLDANVVVSAFIRPDGARGQVLERVLRGGDAIRAVVSPAILAEYRSALAYPKVLRRLELPRDDVSVLVDALAMLSDVVPGERIVQVVAADPEDDKYLGAALEGRAAFVVSGDRHLTDGGAYAGVRVITPRAFLDLME